MHKEQKVAASHTDLS